MVPKPHLSFLYMGDTDWMLGRVSCFRVVGCELTPFLEFRDISLTEWGFWRQA